MQERSTFRKGRPVKEDLYRINHRISAKEVRIVGEGIESKVVPVHTAIKIAQDMDMDLVEISAKAVPPVCRIVDYKKFLYEQKKKQKEIKAKQAKIVVKEIRFGPNTDDHDFNFKLKHAINFLKEGSKVKAYVFFRGRTIVYKERGELLLLRFANELEEFGAVEKLPLLEGKKMIIMINPKKKK